MSDYPSYPTGDPGQQPGYGQQSGYGQQPGYGQYGYHEQGPVRRPGTVLAGCILTWIGTGVGILVGLLVAVAGGSQSFRDELQNQGVAASDINAARISVSLVAVWCLIVLVVSIFAFMGRRWAGLTVMIMGLVYIIFTAVVTITSGGVGSSFVGVLWVLLCVLLIWQLGGAQQWYAAKEAERRAGVR